MLAKEIVLCLSFRPMSFPLVPSESFFSAIGSSSLLFGQMGKTK